eukprot:3789578-Alexandrium_andersonii.AAC.1
MSMCRVAFPEWRACTSMKLQQASAGVGLKVSPRASPLVLKSFATSRDRTKSPRSSCTHRAVKLCPDRPNLLAGTRSKTPSSSSLSRSVRMPSCTFSGSSWRPKRPNALPVGSS